MAGLTKIVFVSLRIWRSARPSADPIRRSATCRTRIRRSEYAFHLLQRSSTDPESLAGSSQRSSLALGVAPTPLSAYSSS